MKRFRVVIRAVVATARCLVGGRTCSHIGSDEAELL